MQREFANKTMNLVGQEWKAHHVAAQNLQAYLQCSDRWHTFFLCLVPKYPWFGFVFATLKYVPNPSKSTPSLAPLEDLPEICQGPRNATGHSAYPTETHGRANWSCIAVQCFNLEVGNSRCCHLWLNFEHDHLARRWCWMMLDVCSMFVTVLVYYSSTGGFPLEHPLSSFVPALA